MALQGCDWLGSYVALDYPESLIEYVPDANGWKPPSQYDSGGMQSYMDVDGDGLDDSLYERLLYEGIKVTPTITGKWFPLPVKGSFKVIIQSNYYDTIWGIGASPRTRLDINGDGLQDYIYHKYIDIYGHVSSPIKEEGGGTGVGHWFYRLNIQNGTAGPEIATDVISENETIHHDHSSISYDYDKDGRDDLIARIPEYSSLCQTRILLSRDKNGVYDLQEAKDNSGSRVLLPQFNYLCSKFCKRLTNHILPTINRNN